MNYRFVKLTKKVLLGSCLAVMCGGFTSCKDDYTLDDEGNYPSWLGNSIYKELSNPNPEVLTGTFKNYVRLIDDLGYAETLAKTGSKTIFPANDEAFERFYANNTWGVSKYEDLTEPMKKQLLYSSMLDNAILVEMLSNVPIGNEVTPGIAMKHSTGVNVIDSITFIQGGLPSTLEKLPANNKYWEKFMKNGIHMVMDATTPMMVHFTSEQMTGNDISTRGKDSDFEIITGAPYSDEDNSAYIFRNKIIKPDVTCQNGYIHQLEDVLVPPGNLAELIRTNGESNYFSRMLDRFSAPFFNATVTNNYNDYAQMYGLQLIDSIFEKRYFSARSQGSSLNVDPNGATVQYLLNFDPGWNTYTNGQTGSNALSDLATIFVPTDEAMKKYFLPGGSGEFLINQFGKLENIEANLNENIDSIPIDIVQAFLNNLMKSSFVGTVPSKFGDVMDDASDPMGINTEVLNKNADGSYDVKIANNGVAYMLNTVFAPNRYVSVSAPALLSENMRIFNQAINDGNGISPLGLNLNFYAYLLAMSANYGFFIPTDDAFKNYYVDPTYLKHDQPRVLKFYYVKTNPYVMCSQWKYNPATGEVSDSLGMVPTANFRSQLIDILNYHTVVLSNDEKMGTNRFYKTKHGGEITFGDGRVASGSQIDNGYPMSYITKTYNQENGVSYAIDHVIQGPINSVYNVLDENDQFSEFMDLCSYISSEVGDTLMGFASDRLSEINMVTKKKRMEAYHVFAAKNGLTDNINYFNTYNYTVYAPDNDAMAIAYQRGLPKWDDIYNIYSQWVDAEDSPARQEARDKALAMIEEINAFIRYHFQDNSVYADNVIEGGEYATANSDTLGIREKLHINGGNGKLSVTDKRGNVVEINGADLNNKKIVNKMTRDFMFNLIASRASSISASSFAVVHQISTPLNAHADTDRYDALWTGANAKRKLAAFRKKYDSMLYKRY